MKRLIFLLTICLCITIITPSAYAEKKWSDVSFDHPYIEGMEELKVQGIIDGYSDGTFKPDSPINRVEALKIIFKSLNIKVSENYSLRDVAFRDINLEDKKWFLPYIAHAMDYHIMRGYGDETFRPEATMTRAEFFKVLAKSMQIIVDQNSLNHFLDVEKDSWQAWYVNHFFSHGFIPEDIKHNFYPENEITRSLAAQIIYLTHYKPQKESSSEATFSSNSSHTSNSIIEGNINENSSSQNNQREDNSSSNGEVSTTSSSSTSSDCEDCPTCDKETKINQALQSYLTDKNLATGYASYYADKFDGRNTANGDIFDNTLLTAAHPYLPFGSMIRVHNVATLDFTDVKVNDCGPFSNSHERVVDLTKTAFESIGNISSGLIDVKIEILSIPEGGSFRDNCLVITHR